ncbi:MAG: tRNA (adenosine(37)-N6)-threonylcarbamoyltransferase complex transferase subunit TsaD [Proteobacteria bacterium]|nr:tRNA (adenosine(37)-N6)-threonylcarbamoyltransferase complex transferase subunit TsaD [Pseudomonadota bacterium]
MKILGIETSCDETAAAIIEAKGDKIRVLSNLISSQVDIHRRFGGIVPEVAAREHLKNILPIIDQARGDISWSEIDYLAVTSGPGLITSLIVGVETAKTLSYSQQIPLIAVNHLEAHLLANFLNHQIKLPALGLIVSGGHTQLILIRKIGDYQIIGQTLDDAAGECFDKVAKLLNVGYPGGPIIEKLAKNGKPTAVNFPRPLIDKANYNFSFSGLKTSVLYFSQQSGFKKYKTADICASFQQAVVDVLVSKTVRAAKTYKVKTVMLAGGVAANKKIRNGLKNMINRELKQVKFFVPEFRLCTDNALMIAVVGYFRAQQKIITPYNKLKADPNWQLD